MTPLPGADRLYPDPHLAGPVAAGGAVAGAWVSPESGPCHRIHPKERRSPKVPSWRYSMFRRWGEEPPLVYVLLNPSTADAAQDDPTIRRCRAFAKREGAGGMVVVNLFAWRATHTDDLLAAHRAGKDVVGPLNNEAIITAMRMPNRGVVVGWGRPVTLPLRRLVLERSAAIMLPAAREAQVDLLCLARTKIEGYPGHPLYIPSTAPLEVWARP